MSKAFKSKAKQLRRFMYAKNVNFLRNHNSREQPIPNKPIKALKVVMPRGL